MNTTKTIFCVVAAAIAVVACNNDGYKKSETGLRYKIFTKKDGQKPKEGDILTMNMIYKRASDDSVLFDTYKVKTPVRVPLQKASFKGGIEEGFAMLGVGDSAAFKLSADSIFLKTFHAEKLPPFIKSKSDLIFVIKMEKIQSSKEVEEEYRVQQEAAMNQEAGDIQNYIKQNKIDAKPTASGLYVMVNKPGSGPQAKDGNEVTVNYVGRLLNGKVFDTSLESAAKEAGIERGKFEPFTFKLGSRSVIPGWEEAIKTMKVGGKSTFLIPSSLGYGSQGAGGVIPPYTPLVFEVELLNIK